MDTNKNIEIYSYNMTNEVRSIIINIITELGGIIVKEEKCNGYNKQNIKLFYDQKTIDYNFINELSLLLRLRLPINLQQIPACNDRLIFHDENIPISI